MQLFARVFQLVPECFLQEGACPRMQKCAKFNARGCHRMQKCAKFNARGCQLKNEWKQYGTDQYWSNPKILRKK